MQNPQAETLRVGTRIMPRTLHFGHAPVPRRSDHLMFSEEEYKRIYWASRRGMLELDLVLMPFVEQRLRQLPAEDQQRYVKLLDSEDTELFAWFLQRQKPQDAELASIVEIVLEYARATGR